MVKQTGYRHRMMVPYIGGWAEGFGPSSKKNSVDTIMKKEKQVEQFQDRQLYSSSNNHVLIKHVSLRKIRRYTYFVRRFWVVGTCNGAILGGMRKIEW